MKLSFVREDQISVVIFIQPELENILLNFLHESSYAILIKLRAFSSPGIANQVHMRL